MHREREHRAGRKHQPIQIDGDLPRIENRDERDCGNAADKRRDHELQNLRLAGSVTFVAIGEMTMAAWASGHAGAKNQPITRIIGPPHPEDDAR